MISGIGEAWNARASAVSAVLSSPTGCSVAARSREDGALACRAARIRPRGPTPGTSRSLRSRCMHACTCIWDVRRRYFGDFLYLFFFPLGPMHAAYAPASVQSRGIPLCCPHAKLVEERMHYGPWLILRIQYKFQCRRIT